MSYAYLFKYIIIGDTGTFESLSHARLVVMMGGNDLLRFCDPLTRSLLIRALAVLLAISGHPPAAGRK